MRTIVLAAEIAENEAGRFFRPKAELDPAAYSKVRLYCLLTGKRGPRAGLASPRNRSRSKPLAGDPILFSPST